MYNLFTKGNFRMNHNIIFPLPTGIHLGFVAISVVILLLCYARRKYAYELYLLIGILSTLLIYLVGDSKATFYILGLEQVILLVMAIVDMAKVSAKQSATEKAAKSHK